MTSNISFLDQMAEQNRQESADELRVPENWNDYICVKSRAGIQALIFFFLAFTLFGVAATQFLGLVQLYDRNDFNTVWPVLLCVATVPVLGLSIYFLLQWLKYDESQFYYQHGCNYVGSTLAGFAVVSSRVAEAETVHVKLTCTERTRRQQYGLFGSMAGGRSSRVDTERESASRKVPCESFQLEGEKCNIPIKLPIASAGESTMMAMNRSVSWKLDIWAELHGVDFHTSFPMHIH